MVVGAGPAGLTAAKKLAQTCNVLLLDKATFPRTKVCGCCLNARTLQLIELVFGCRIVSLLDDSAVSACRFFVRGDEFVLRLSSKTTAIPLAVSRSRLDSLLLKSAIESGSHFVSGCRVTGSQQMNQERRLEVRGEEGEFHITTDAVIAADGLGSRLAEAEHLAIRQERGAKVGATLLFDSVDVALARGEMAMVVGEEGYAGVARFGNKEGLISAAVSPAAVKELGGPKEAIRSILAKQGVDRQLGLTSIFAGHDAPKCQVSTLTCPALHRQVSRPWVDRMLFAGDAAGYHEPITGEGIARAMDGGLLAADALKDGWKPETGTEYENGWRRIIGSRRNVVRLASALTARPRFAWMALRVLTTMPQLGKSIWNR